MKNKHTIPIILLIVISVVIFSNTFKNPFMWDDRDLIVENKYIEDLEYIPFLFSAQYWNHYYPGLKGQYRPVTLITFALDWFFWEDNALGYHLTNLLLHILNVILIYFLIFKLLEPNVRRGLINIPFLSAVFFATHPIHIESVTWIKNRFDLVSLLFFLSSILLFIRYTSKERIRFRMLSYYSSLLFFPLALLSKEMAITLPFILFFYILCFLPKDEQKKAKIATLPFFGLMTAYLVIKFSDLINIISAVYVAEIGLYSNILAVLKTLGYYLKLLILPVGLNAEHVMRIPKSIFEPRVFFTLSLLVSTSIIAIKTFKRSKFFFFGVLWFFVTILPVSNIMFLYSRPIAEQRLYIPSVGLCVILAICIRNLGLKKIAVLLAFLVFIFYSSSSIKRNFDWRNPVSFWKKTAELSSKSPRAYNNLGVEYYDIGKIKKAVASYKKAIEIYPKYVIAYNNLGVAYQDMEKNEKAIESFKKAIELNPEYIDAYNNLANMYMITDKKERAISLYKRIIEMNPDHAGAYNNLAVAYYYQKEYSLAIEHCDRALELRAEVSPKFLALLKPYRK